MGEDAQPKKLDKYHERLARLEQKPVTEDIVEMSQNEYLAHIDFLRQEIRAAWGRNERVNTLKLVIQVMWWCVVSWLLLLYFFFY